jgi:hypothetical protein
VDEQRDDQTGSGQCRGGDEHRARSDRAAQDVGEHGARELADEPRIDVVAEHEANDVVVPARFLMAALRAYRGCTV